MTNRDFHVAPWPQATGQRSARIAAGQLLVALRRHRIPCSIDSFSDKGWTARLGDPASGAYSQQGRFPSRQAAAEWMLDEATRRGTVTSTERD
jgi:hypothetical protein